MKTAKDLKRFQSQMRAKKRMTKAEKLVKKLLEEDGREFKTQVIVGFYIVDFVIPNKMLIIEIDGEYHKTDYQKWYDQRRDIFISRCLFQILRIPNENAGKVIDLISSYPNAVGWEKKFRRGLGIATMLKGKMMNERNNREGQTKLL